MERVILAFSTSQANLKMCKFGNIGILYIGLVISGGNIYIKPTRKKQFWLIIAK